MSHRLDLWQHEQGVETHLKPGDKVKDTVTGLTGIVTGVAFYLNGCVQALIEPPVRVGQEYREIWIDDDRLTVVPPRKPAKRKAATRKRGGPGSAPPARSGGRGR